jgi:GNAT superfamily N-acetyltransferase
VQIESPRAEQIPALRALWTEAFGDGDAFLDCFFGSVFANERSRCLTVNGTAAAALYWFDCAWQGERIAYLYAVATARAYRGRGYCHALMEHTAAHLAERGYAGAILVPGEPSLYDFYGKMGYQPVTRIGCLHGRAGERPLALRRVDATEYAALRRQLLPEGGVVQEGAALPLLQAQYELYAGEKLLLCAQRRKGVLHGAELLGNAASVREAIPGILRALDCSEGVFRTPGEEQPFAAYR